MMRVALFITCFNDTMFAETGTAVVTVLERFGHTVEFPLSQTCRGQMHFNTGHRPEAEPLVRGFAALRGLRRGGHPVGVVCWDGQGEPSDPRRPVRRPRAACAGGRGRATGVRVHRLPRRPARPDRCRRGLPVEGAHGPRTPQVVVVGNPATRRSA